MIKKAVLSIGFLLAVILLGILLCIALPNANASELDLAWDANTTGVTPDGYRLFQRVQGTPYDYNAPLCDTPGTTCKTADLPAPDAPALPAPNNVIAAWNATDSTVTITFGQVIPDPAELSYFWVVRAYNHEGESADSNEVEHTVTTAAVVDRWVIYYFDDEWIPLDSIDGESGALETISPLTIVGPGEVKNVNFRVAVFAEGETAGVNSSSAIITIDRRLPDAPTGLTKTVVIPVQ